MMCVGAGWAKVLVTVFSPQLKRRPALRVFVVGGMLPDRAARTTMFARGGDGGGGGCGGGRGGVPPGRGRG